MVGATKVSIKSLTIILIFFTRAVASHETNEWSIFVSMKVNQIRFCSHLFYDKIDELFCEKTAPPDQEDLAFLDLFLLLLLQKVPPPLKISCRL